MPKPLKAVSYLEVQTHAISIALKEAQLDGLLTPETITRIADRADAISTALMTGKIVETSHDGVATIRDAEPEEEKELADPLEYPAHHAAKTTLDV